MFDIKLTPRAVKDLKKLPEDIQKRIHKKLDFFAQNDPIAFSNPLVDLPPATRRFRVGAYRLTFYVIEQALYIVRIQHRKDIYLP